MSSIVASTFPAMEEVKQMSVGDMDDYVRKLISQGELKKARSLLETAGVNYDFVSKTPGPGRQINGPKPQDWFEYSNDAVSTFVWPKIDGPSNHFEVSMYWILDASGDDDIIDLDRPVPADPVVIAWEEDIFGHVEGSTSSICELWYAEKKKKDPREKRKGKMDIISQPVIDDPGNAIVGKVKDGDRLYWWEYGGDTTLDPIRATGNLSLTLRKQTDSKGKIATRYEHTWSIAGAATWNIVESLSISGKTLGISIDLPSGADSWDIDYRKDH